MQEVKIQNNELGIPIYFADLPNFSEIPSSTLNLLMQELEKEIVEFVEKKATRKKYRDSKKKEHANAEEPP